VESNPRVTAHVQHEIRACSFQHDAIVPMIHQRIEVDLEMSVKANCRPGVNDVLIMPWYTSSLNKCPSGNFTNIAIQGKRIMSALEYIHGEGYVHLDVKGTNIFVTSDKMWYLGDFGSCKPIGQRVTSSTFQFCYENIAFQTAKVIYDWFMFLLLVLIETLAALSF
jgi:serine/threonine protein kinase